MSNEPRRQWTTYDDPAVEHLLSLAEILAGIAEILQERAPHFVRRNKVTAFKESIRTRAKKQGVPIEAAAQATFCDAAVEYLDMLDAAVEAEEAANAKTN